MNTKMNGENLTKNTINNDFKSFKGTKVENIVGNTPIIKINYEYLGKKSFVYAKLEYYNLSGSIKDRVAFYIINNAYKRNTLKEGMPIIEATSGNTGIALSSLGALYNHPVYIFMPDFASIERINLMKLYGANVILVSKEEGGFIACVNKAKELAKKLNGFLANQFANEDNYLAHYETTAPEIISKNLDDLGGYISGVGTGGTLIGVGSRLKEEYKDFKVIAIEPDKMQILSGKNKGTNHKIEGIGDDFVPDLYNKNLVDEIIPINDEDAVNMSRLIAKKLGLGVGISSGANFIGSVIAESKYNKKMVTIFADDNKKYLSTDLTKPIDLNKDFLSNKIKLIDFEIIK